MVMQATNSEIEPYPNAGDPAPKVCQCRENDHSPPCSPVLRQAIEQAVIQSQEARLDAPKNCPEQSNDHEFIPHVGIAVVEQCLSGWDSASANPEQVVQVVYLESLKYCIGREEEECCEHPDVVGVQSLRL